MNKAALKDFVQLAQSEINNGSVEDKLRHILSAHLSLIFPDNPWWVQEHVMGTETFLHFSSSTGKERYGFADSVVGKTAKTKKAIVALTEESKDIEIFEGL